MTENKRKWDSNEFPRLQVSSDLSELSFIEAWELYEDHYGSVPTSILVATNYNFPKWPATWPNGPTIRVRPAREAKKLVKLKWPVLKVQVIKHLPEDAWMLCGHLGIVYSVGA